MLAACRFLGSRIAAVDGSSPSRCLPSGANCSKRRSVTIVTCRRGSEGDAVSHALHEMREKDRVHGHVFVSDEAAADILRWMAQGAKQP